MFTTPNFIKLFLALLFASGSSYLPIIGDVGSLIGDGPGATIVGFFILLAFYWFVISKAFEFLAFAFGGGVGRYSTTKQYRRLQWLTFLLFMSVPVFVLVVLAVSATPIGEHSPRYEREVRRIKATRLSAAKAERSKRFDTSVQARRGKIDAARKQRIVDIAVAKRRRELNINIAKSDRKKAIAADVEKQKHELEAEWEVAKSEARNESGPIGRQINEITGIKRHEKSVRDQYYREMMTFLDYAREKWKIKNNLDNRIAMFDVFDRDLNIIRWRYLNVDCGSYFEGTRYSEIKELKKPDQCIMLVVLMNYDANVKDGEGNVLDLPLVREAGSDLVKLVRLLPDHDVELEQRLATIDDEFKQKLASVKHSIPPVDMSQFPKVDEADFPHIDEADYPAVQLSDFPLRIDQSPIDAEDPYWERITPTFLENFWWIGIASVLIWLWVQESNKSVIGWLYGRVTRFLDEGRFGFGGSARFATMFEEWSKAYKPGTLYIGRSLYKPFWSDEIGLDGEAHMLTVAGSRGGKGTTAIIPNLLLWEGSCVVVDPKGTNAHVTAEARRKMGQKVHLIDPFGIVTDKSDSFDPFETLDPSDARIRERITSIADALVVRDENTRDQHWDDGAQTIISGMISHILSGKAKCPKSLHSVRDLLNRMPEEQDRMWAEMAFNDDAGGYAKDAANRFIRGADTNEILGIMSNADKHTEWLSSSVMRDVTSNPTFKLSDLKKQPTTVYLIIPPLHLGRQKRLIRLFINLMLNVMEDGGRSEIPVLMMIDEFLALDRMPEIPNAFATMASYNLTIWVFVQELRGLQEKYKNEFNAFIANSRALQVFAASDDTTKEYVSKRLGNRPLGGLGGIAKSNDNVPLRSPDDIEKDLKASEARQYIIEAGSSALLIEKIPYFKKRSRFAGRYDPDPDFER